MVLGAKLCSSSNGGNTTTTSTSKEGNWGMGFLLVFFHPHPDGDPPNYQNNQSSNPLRKRNSFSLSSPLKSPTTNAALLAKTQSTLSICGLLVFTTLLLFTLSTFEPTSITTTTTSAANYRSSSSSPRRMLHQISRSGIFRKGPDQRDANSTHIAPALQGMGVLYRKGSKGMTDLVVGHVAEGATEREVATFTRLIHHSGLLSRSDLVFIFDSPGSAARLGQVVRAESEDFVRVVWLCKEANSSCTGLGPGFGMARYLRGGGVAGMAAGWGRRRGGGNWSESTPASYGSVVGFDSSELDPEGSLTGFLDHVPMSLRRWACYPMLLGRVRRHFKHVMLADVRGALVLSDPFARVRNKSTESVLVWPESDPEPTRVHGHSRRGRTTQGRLNPSVVIGGGRGVRRFTAAALTEIVRAVVERKGGKQGRNSVTESGLVNQLVHSGHLLKNINVITSAESIPDASSLAGFNSLDSSGSSSFLAFSEYFSVVQRSNSNSGKNVDIDTIIRKEICSSHELYSSVYRDCLASDQ